MSLGGGSRISGFTIFVAITLIVYTFLATGLVSVYAQTTWVNQYGGIDFDWKYAESFSDTDYGNLTRPTLPLLFNDLELNDLSPNRKVAWIGGLLESDWFKVSHKGTDWWNGWFYYIDKPNKLTEDEILANVDYEDESSHFVFNLGDNNYETHVFFYPLSYTSGGSELVYIYDTLEESFDNDAVTIVVGVNATLPSYDVFQIFGMVSGFQTYGDMPPELSYFLSTIFWALCLMLLVKLFVG